MNTSLSILKKIVVLCLITLLIFSSLIACGEEEKDEYEKISKAFSLFLEGAESYEIHSVEKCIDDDETEYYYFTVKIVDDFSKKHGLEETGGIMVYSGGDSFEFDHLDVISSPNNLTMEKFNEMKANGKCHELSADELKILDERIKALESKE